MSKYEIYTDGSAIGTSSNFYGGWAAIVMKDKIVIDILKGSKFPSTNNEMELTAIKEAVLYISKLDRPKFGGSYVIYTDSNYSLMSVTVWCKQWMINGWKNSKKEEIKNKELIQEIIKLIQENSYIEIKKVKGHNGNIGNEMADDYATEQSIELKYKILKENFKNERNSK